MWLKMAFLVSLVLLVGCTARSNPSGLEYNGNYIGTISSSNLSIDGNITADAFYGDGSHLTGIVASANVTGVVNGSFANFSGIELGDRTTGDSPCIYFNDDTYHDESLCWNDGNDRFQLTDDIYSSTDIIASSKMQSVYYTGQYINLVRFSNSPYISFSDIDSETDYYIYNEGGSLVFKDTSLNIIFKFTPKFGATPSTTYYYSHLDVAGNITGNNLYGELFYNNRTATQLDFATQNKFYPLWFNNATYKNGFYAKIGGMQSISNISNYVDGTYMVSYMASGDGQNNHVYVISVFVNEANKKNCENMHKMAAGGDIITQSGSCIIPLNANDKVTLRVADITGTGTGNYYSGNINVLRVGE